MAGKLCTGVPRNNVGGKNFRNSIAFCEGLAFRTQGTAVAFPITGNPQEALSEAAVSWDAGWTVADTASPGAVDAADATCCAVPATLVAA